MPGLFLCVCGRGWGVGRWDEGGGVGEVQGRGG